MGTTATIDIGGLVLVSQLVSDLPVPRVVMRRVASKQGPPEIGKRGPNYPRLLDLMSALVYVPAVPRILFERNSAVVRQPAVPSCVAMMGAGGMPPNRPSTINQYFQQRGHGNARAGGEDLTEARRRRLEGTWLNSRTSHTRLCTAIGVMPVPRVGRALLLSTSRGSDCGCG